VTYRGGKVLANTVTQALRFRWLEFKPGNPFASGHALLRPAVRRRNENAIDDEVGACAVERVLRSAFRLGAIVANISELFWPLEKPSLAALTFFVGR
jgi:hypothetical protein